MTGLTLGGVDQARSRGESVSPTLVRVSRRRLAFGTGLLCLLALAGCTKSSGLDDGGPELDADGADVITIDGGSLDSGPGGPDGSPDLDGSPNPDAGEMDVGVVGDAWIDSGPPPTVDKVDLLLVIDNSGSTTEEQASLKAELPALVRALAEGRSPDGTTFSPVEDLRVGVVTSDMGTGGFAIPTCGEPNFGDDGILQRTSDGAGCDPIPADASPYLSLEPATGDLAAFTEDLRCLADRGTSGCGFEQQLDAMLKAVTPEASPIRFVMDSTGHADGLNEDFVRPDSLLIVVMLTDEDDCSASDPRIFDRNNDSFTPDLNLRCWRHGEAVHPSRRYVDGLLAVHPPERIIFHLIAGIPVDLSAPDGERTDYRTLIGDPSVRDPRMVETLDPDNPSQLTPSCNVPGRGVAYPPVRLVTMARDLQARGATSFVQSICRADIGLTTSLLSRVALHL